MQMRMSSLHSTFKEILRKTYGYKENRALHISTSDATGL